MPGLSFEIAVTPVSDVTFVCTAELKETDSGRVLAAPRIQFKAGASAEVDSRDDIAGVHFGLIVSVDAAHATANYSLVYQRVKDRPFTFKQKGSIALAGPNPK